jgi:hypothetical protein
MSLATAPEKFPGSQSVQGDAPHIRSGRGLCEDWSKLIGRTVEVWFNGKRVAIGRIEEAASDDSVVWIAGEGNDTRKLYDRGTGYQIWVEEPP